MSINKKRIAQRQQAAAEAAKKEKNSKILTMIAYGALIVGVVLVFTVAIVLAISAGKTYYADIQIQDYGTITVKLDRDAAPITVDNFMDLAKKGYYEGSTFHRIMEGFMMQGGIGKKDAASAKVIKGEFAENGWENPISHIRGTISMARTDDPNSATSQFFIVHEDSTFLDGKYAAFGAVVEGIEIVDAVCEASKPTDNNGTIPADQQPIITSITIRTK